MARCLQALRPICLQQPTVGYVFRAASEESQNDSCSLVQRPNCALARRRWEARCVTSFKVLQHPGHMHGTLLRGFATDLFTNTDTGPCLCCNARGVMKTVLLIGSATELRACKKAFEHLTCGLSQNASSSRPHAPLPPHKFCD